MRSEKHQHDYYQVERIKRMRQCGYVLVRLFAGIYNVVTRLWLYRFYVIARHGQLCTRHGRGYRRYHGRGSSVAL